MQIVLSFIPLMVIVILMKLFKIRIEDKKDYYINMFFWSFVTFIIYYILTIILKTLLPVIYMDYSMGNHSFFIIFITAALTEELSKYLSIKLSKPIDNKYLIVNAILISTIFSVIEHYTYLGSILSNESVFIRLVTPGHALYILIPILLILKSNNKINKLMYTIIGLLIGMVVHTIFDVIDKNIIIALIFAIIGYSVIIYSLYKASKIQNEQLNNVSQISNDNLNIKKNNFTIIKIIFIVICCLFLVFAFDSSNNLSKTGSSCHNETSNLDMKVVSSIKTTAKDLFGREKNYIKVYVELKNNTSESVTINEMDFSLLSKSNNEPVYVSTSSFDDDIQFDILKPNNSINGYLYFETEGNIIDYRLSYKPFDLNPKSCIFELQ